MVCISNGDAVFEGDENNRKIRGHRIKRGDVEFASNSPTPIYEAELGRGYCGETETGRLLAVIRSF